MAFLMALWWPFHFGMRHDIGRHGEFLSLACPEVPPKGSPKPTGEVWLLKATPKNGPTPTQEGGWLLWLFTFGPNGTLVMSHKKNLVIVS